MKRFLATAALLATAIAAPASAVTLVAGFNGVGADVASVSASNISINLNVSARIFANVAPNALTNISQVATVGTLTRVAGGVGILGGASSPQMDTNQAGAREAYLVSADKAFYLTGLRLTFVDSDDTLQIYGVNGDGSLVNFTYGTGTDPTNNAVSRAAGAINSGAGGSLLNLTTSTANSGTASFDTGLTDTRFTRYLITTRVGGEVTYLGAGGQGFTLSGLTATVPEPATWGLMLVGFGLVGVAARRRSTAVAA